MCGGIGYLKKSIVVGLVDLGGIYACVRKCLSVEVIA